MKKSPLIALLHKIDAGYCGAADEYLEGRVSANKAWRECPRVAWMMWFLRRIEHKLAARIQKIRSVDTCDVESCDRPQCIEQRKTLRAYILKHCPKCPRITKKMLRGE